MQACALKAALMVKRKLRMADGTSGDGGPHDTSNPAEAKGSRPCSHRPPCPGCPNFGASGLAPNTEIHWRQWCTQMNVADVAVHVGDTFGYRHRVRLAVRGRASNPKFGLFEEGTHRVVDIPACVVHHPTINEVAQWLKAHARKLRLPPYSDVHHAGLLRYVQLAVERKSGRVQVVLVGNSADEASLLPFLLALRADAPANLHSLVFNGHPERTNAVFGSYWKVFWGDAFVIDEIAGAQVFYPPGAFSQANPNLFERLVGEIHQWVGPGADLVEMYCGVGAIGLGLVPSARDVVFNEISPQGLMGLEQGLLALRGGCSSLPDVAIASGDARSALPYVSARTTVVLDPPRKGLEPAIIDALCDRRPRKLVYVSCGFQAFKRDAEALVRFGYELRRARAFALFPFTDHVETLAEFVLE